MVSTTEESVAPVEHHRTTDIETLSPNAIRVLKARYLKRDAHGNCTESAGDLFRRVAQAIAEPELAYPGGQGRRSECEEAFYELMASGRFMPNSPTLMNAGREMGMLSACFVLPVGDSINEIFDAIKYTALIQKAGGGTGFAFDELRPTGDYIKSSGGTTSGPISFWRAFSEATNAIQQGAFRRGANMGMMYIHHPDILKFLHAKEDLTKFTNYNISVKVTDEWMESFLLDPDSPHVVRNPRTGNEYYMTRDLDLNEYDLSDLRIRRYANSGDIPLEPPPNVYTKQDVWNIIIKNAWRTGEPGVVFIDRINESNPTPHVARIEATNPCGEQPLLPYEACNLGSINLGRFILDECTDQARVDWDSMRQTIRLATRFLDNVIDANKYPLPQIDKICKANRKIGLGVMGFADALYKLGAAYNSDEGTEWGERFMKFLNDESHQYSEELAAERGVFANWKGSIWDTKYNRPMRNAACTTVAPTGTISIIAGCSGGIEPLFSLVFIRRVLKGQDKSGTPMIEINPVFELVAKEKGFFSEGLMDRIAMDGTLANICDLPEDVGKVFVCAHDVTPEWHAKMQAAFQRHCDASISKTINFPQGATPDDVETIYRTCYKLGCKGVTVYRNACRESQPMALKTPQSEHQTNGEATQAQPDPGGRVTEPIRDPIPDVEPRDVDEIVSGLRIRQMTPFGNMHVKITVDPRTERELEVFAQLGKGGDIATSDLEAICRMISLWLRSGGRLYHVIQQLKGIGSSLQVPTREGRIMSLGDGLARALRKYQRAKERFGLQDLLLGRVDWSELDLPVTATSTEKRKNGNGNGGGKQGNGSNGGSNGGGNGSGKPIAECPVTDPKRHAGTAEALVANCAASVSNSLNAAFKLYCPECQSLLAHGEGCIKCEACGYAHC